MSQGTSSLIFGRLRSTPDGRPRIFHEKLQWNSQSKLKTYSLENLHYKSRQQKVDILQSISKHLDFVEDTSMG